MFFTLPALSSSKAFCQSSSENSSLAWALRSSAKDRFDFLVLEGKIRHCLEGRQLAGGGIWCALIVQVTEAVQSHQIEGVQQPTADGVCGMVAVCELAVVGDDTGRRIGRDIVIATVHADGAYTSERKVSMASSTV